MAKMSIGYIRGYAKLKQT